MQIIRAFEITDRCRFPVVVCKIYDRTDIAADCSVVCVVEIGACPCLWLSFDDNYGLLVAADTIATLPLSGAICSSGMSGAVIGLWPVLAVI